MTSLNFLVIKDALSRDFSPFWEMTYTHVIIVIKNVSTKADEQANGSLLERLHNAQVIWRLTFLWYMASVTDHKLLPYLNLIHVISIG